MDLIASIYEALEDDEVLGALPDMIANEIGSRSCTLQLFSPEMELEGSWLNHFNGPLYDYYVEHDMHRHDAWTNTNLNVFGLNKTARHTDYLPIDQFCNTFFYNEVIRRFGDDSAYCLGFISTRPDGGLAVIGLQKALSDTDFTDEQVERFEAFRPHLTRMAVLRRNLLAREQKAEGALLGIDSIEDAYLVIQPDRKILFANAAAETLLANASLLRPMGRNLFLSRSIDDDQLVKAIADAAANRVDGRVAFLAYDDAAQPWRFMIAPKAHGGETMLLVWIDSGEVGASASEAMQQIYGLTPAEQNVLLAACEGLTANQIAERLTVAVATVRTHLQHIYFKMGVNKASQLSRLVASLPKVLK